MGAGEQVIHEGVRSVQSEAKAHDKYRQSRQPCNPGYGLPKTGLLKNLDPNGSKEGAHKNHKGVLVPGPGRLGKLRQVGLLLEYGYVFVIWRVNPRALQNDLE